MMMEMLMFQSFVVIVCPGPKSSGDGGKKKKIYSISYDLVQRKPRKLLKPGWLEKKKCE